MITEKQQLFVLAYLRLGNIVEALTEAGLNLTRREGELLLRSEEVQKFLDTETAALVERSRIYLYQHENMILEALMKEVVHGKGIPKVQAAKILLERIDAAFKSKQAATPKEPATEIPLSSSFTEEQLRNLAIKPIRPSAKAKPG